MGGGRLELMRGWDINCDLGEGEPEALTAGLCAGVGRINVACGGHGGDDSSMRRCVRLACHHRLKLGAHPGLPGESGRGTARIEVVAFTRLVREQVQRLVAVAERDSGAVGHVKLHGTLYHAVEGDEVLGEAMAGLMRDRFAGMEVVGLPGRVLERACRHAGVAFVREGFLDRGYREDGRLIPRGEPGALLAMDAVVDRWREWLQTGTIGIGGNRRLEMRVDTWCVHGDTPGALEMVRTLARETGRG